MSLCVRYYRNAYKRVVHCELEFEDGTLFSAVPGSGARFVDPLAAEATLWNSGIDWRLGCITLPVPCVTDGAEEELQALARGLVGGPHAWFARFISRWTPFTWPLSTGWYDAEVVAYMLKSAGLPLRGAPWSYSASSLYREHLRVIND